PAVAPRQLQVLGRGATRLGGRGGHRGHFYLLVPTLCVGTPVSTLCVEGTCIRRLPGRGPRRGASQPCVPTRTVGTRAIRRTASGRGARPAGRALPRAGTAAPPPAGWCPAARRRT